MHNWSGVLTIDYPLKEFVAIYLMKFESLAISPMKLFITLSCHLPLLLLLFGVPLRANVSAGPLVGPFGFYRKIDPKWLPDDSRQWQRTAESVFLSDLSKVVPGSALTTGRRQLGKWKLLPFETVDLKGIALSTYMNTGAPEVRIPLHRTGWYAVYIGLSTTSGGITKATRNGVRVKLSRDRNFRRMANNLELISPRRDVVQEQFLDVSHLEASDEVVIAPMHNQPSTIAYVRLVPLTNDEQIAWHRDLAETQYNTSIYTADGGSWIWPYDPRSVADLQDHFRGMPATDVGKWWFQIGADQVYYRSKVGTLRFEGVEDYHKPLRKDHAESLRLLLAKGINPLQVAREAAREQGSEFHVIMRPAAWAASYPFEELFASRFYNEHPEWRCVDYEGKRVMYMSYAVPEVRRHVVAMFKEAVKMVDPDGVGFIFTRGMPMMLWEPAFCESFREVYGLDPRQLPENDARVYDVRARIMNQLLREIRAMLDEVGAQRGGRRYKLSLSPYSNEAGNRRFGFDVATWIREGLVDDIVIAVNSGVVRGPDGGIAPPDLEYYKRLVQGTSVKIYPMVVAVTCTDSKRHAATVLDYLRRGADGISVWDPVMEAGSAGSSIDTGVTSYRGNTMDLLSYMGHRKLFEYWNEHGFPEIRSFPMQRLGDNTYSKWYPNSGY